MARRFEMEEGGSRKFWEIASENGTVTVRFGRIGTDGQTKVKDLGSPADAAKEVAKLVTEKTKKGYVEVGANAAPAAPAPAAPSSTVAAPAAPAEAPVAPAASVAPAAPPAPVGPMFGKVFDGGAWRQATWSCNDGARRRRVDPDLDVTIAALVRGWRFSVRSREEAEALLARAASLPADGLSEPAAVLAYSGWEISEARPRDVVVGAIIAARASDNGPDNIVAGATGPGGAPLAVLRARESWADEWVANAFAGFAPETAAPVATFFVAAGAMGDAYLALGNIGAKIPGLPFSKRPTDSNGKKKETIAGILLAHAAWDECACMQVDFSPSARDAELAKVSAAGVAKPIVVIAASYDSRS